MVSYSISGSGHGVDVDAAKAAFAEFVTALDEATLEGGTKFAGGITGSEADDSETWRPWGITAEDVRAGTAAPVSTEAESEGAATEDATEDAGGS